MSEAKQVTIGGLAVQLKDATARSMAEAKYTKPGTGIPKTDLADGVQTSLGKADSAIQSADLATVATSGSYGDLVSVPAVPTATEINNVLAEVTA